MDNNETCIHGGVSPINLLSNLPYSQAGSGRHRCPTCAYEQGFNLGSTKQWDSYDSFCKSLTDAEKCKDGNIAPTSILIALGVNQGGTGRHKCTNCAFKEGFEVGLVESITKKISLDLVPQPINIVQKVRKRIFSSTTIDFIEKEIKNKQLGLLGELFILKNEIDYLTSQGKPDLANKVSHVSVVIGDGLGYDILSFHTDGSEKKIEVKTTRGDINRLFYITKNELDFSIENPDNFYLYRLFDFDPKLEKGKYYEIKGDLTKSLNLDPVLYVAYPKVKSK